MERHEQSLLNTSPGDLTRATPDREDLIIVEGYLASSTDVDFSNEISGSCPHEVTVI